jgi:hypothetical protein
MKKNLKNILLGALLFAGVMNSSAQKTAVTFSFFNAAFYANTSPISQGYMGIGLERNVGDYIALKLEVNNGFQILYNLTDGKILQAGSAMEKSEEYTDANGDPQEFYYHWTVPSFDINYQSKFFFRGNDKTGAYLSMGLGVRSVKYIFHVGSITDYNYEKIPKDIQKKNEYSENLVVVPLILRVGGRGEIQGFFPDFSFGIGYNIAHNKTIQDKTITKTWDLSVPTLSGFTAVGSIAFGIGW